MVEEQPGDKVKEPIKLASQTDGIFERLSSIEPELRSLLDDEGGEETGGHQTLSEKMEESPNLSDIQTLDKGLFPDFGFKHLNVLPVSMIIPETFIPYRSLLVKDLLSEHEELSFVEALVFSDTALSIGFIREGRIDKLALGGAAKEEEEKKDLKKGLGFGL